MSDNFADAGLCGAGFHVLVVDDDAALCAEVSQYLQAHGMSAECAVTMASARTRLDAGGVDLVLLDLRLGHDDGFDLLRELRKAGEIPCIVITGKNDITDRIVGLELGADDYLFKPVNPRELLARIRALLRRVMVVEAHKAGDQPPRRRWQFDPGRRILRAPHGTPVALTTAEWDLLIALAAHEGQTQTRTDLSHKVFQRPWHPTDRSLDSVVVNLRRKLEPNPDHPVVIQSIRGKGYLFTGFPMATETGAVAAPPDHTSL
jgi:DNA-binding response OmpR family regulator